MATQFPIDDDLPPDEAHEVDSDAPDTLDLPLGGDRRLIDAPDAGETQDTAAMERAQDESTLRALFDDPEEDDAAREDARQARRAAKADGEDDAGPRLGSGKREAVDLSAAEAYMEMSRTYTGMTPADITALAIAAKGDGPAADEARDLLARHTPKWLRKCISKLRSNNPVIRRWTEDSDLDNELLGWATEGLMEAVENFDPTRGVGFLGVSELWIRKVIQENVEKSTHNVNASTASAKRDVESALRRANRQLVTERAERADARKRERDEARRLEREEADRMAAMEPDELRAYLLAKAGTTVDARTVTDRVQSVAETMDAFRGKALHADHLARVQALLRADAIEHLQTTRGIAHPTDEQIVESGGFSEDRIRKLLALQVGAVSMSRTLGDDGAELGDTIAADTQASFADEAAEALADDVAGFLPIMISPKQAAVFAAAKRLPRGTRRVDRAELSAFDIGRQQGITSDSADKYVEQVTRNLEGLDGEDVDAVRRPKVKISLNRAREILSGQPWLSDEDLASVRRGISLREALEAAGVVFKSVNTDRADVCPFEGADQPVGAWPFRVEDDERYSCNRCGAHGTIVEWLAHAHGATLPKLPNDARASADAKREKLLREAQLLAVQLANALPPEAQRFVENGRAQVLASRTPERRERFRGYIPR